LTTAEPTVSGNSNFLKIQDFTRVQRRINILGAFLPAFAGKNRAFRGNATAPATAQAPCLPRRAARHPCKPVARIKTAKAVLMILLMPGSITGITIHNTQSSV
jgi:hypothetical protein